MIQLSPSVDAPPEGVRYCDAPGHQGAATLAAYWEAARAGHSIPDRSSIIPSEIVRLLPNIFISEILDGGNEYRFRIFGTALVDLFGREMTGKRLVDLGKQSNVVTNADAASHRWRKIVDCSYRNTCPVFATGHLVNTIHRSLEWHSFTAPLTVGGGEITQILGGLFFDETR